MGQDSESYRQEERREQEHIHYQVEQTKEQRYYVCTARAGKQDRYEELLKGLTERRPQHFEIYRTFSKVDKAFRN